MLLPASAVLVCVVAADTPLPHLLLDTVGGVLAMVAQIRAKLWVRNGEGVATEAFHYVTAPQCMLMRDLDMKVLQVCGCGRAGCVSGAVCVPAVLQRLRWFVCV